MKRLRFLFALLAVASVDHAVRAEGNGYGAKAYAAGAVAATGALGGAYKLYGRYRTYAEKNSLIEQKKQKFDKIIDDVNSRIDDHHHQLGEQLMTFLTSSGVVYEVFVEGADKLQELITTLEKMQLKIIHAHIPHTKTLYSTAQKELLVKVNSLLDVVRAQRKYANKWVATIDQSYENFIKVVRSSLLNCITSSSAGLAGEGRSSGDREYSSDRSTSSNPSLVLPASALLEDAASEVRRQYTLSAEQYENLKDLYNYQYGSYFTRLKGYFSGYFKDKQLAKTPVSSQASSVSTVPASAIGAPVSSVSSQTTSSAPATSSAPGRRELVRAVPSSVGVPRSGDNDDWDDRPVSDADRREWRRMGLLPAR